MYVCVAGLCFCAFLFVFRSSCIFLSLYRLIDKDKLSIKKDRKRERCSQNERQIEKHKNTKKREPKTAKQTYKKRQIGEKNRELEKGRRESLSF